MPSKTSNDVVKWIDDSLFNKIKNNVPLVCVDVLVVHNGKLLLMLRNNEPAKDRWFTPGGRVYRGETLEEAVYRILRRETGLTPKRIEQKGTMSHFWSNFQAVTVFHLVTVFTKDIQMNEEHRDHKWITRLSDDLHPYVKEMIQRSNIFQSPD